MAEIKACSVCVHFREMHYGPLVCVGPHAKISVISGQHFEFLPEVRERIGPGMCEPVAAHHWKPIRVQAKSSFWKRLFGNA